MAILVHTKNAMYWWIIGNLLSSHNGDLKLLVVGKTAVGDLNGMWLHSSTYEKLLKKRLSSEEVFFKCSKRSRWMVLCCEETMCDRWWSYGFHINGTNNSSLALVEVLCYHRYDSSFKHWQNWHIGCMNEIHQKQDKIPLCETDICKKLFTGLKAVQMQVIHYFHSIVQLRPPLWHAMRHKHPWHSVHFSTLSTALPFKIDLKMPHTIAVLLFLSRMYSLVFLRHSDSWQTQIYHLCLKPSNTVNFLTCTFL